MGEMQIQLEDDTGYYLQLFETFETTGAGR
jgi:hypothetical protein